MKWLPVLYLAYGVSASSVASERAETAFAALQEWYNETTGLWNTCGWWNGANCMTAVADLAAADSNVLSSATSIFAHTYTAAPVANPKNNVLKIARTDHVETVYGEPEGDEGVTADPSVDDYLNSCYDDNAWWALAWIAAYDLTKNQGYLDLAAGIFNQNLTGAGPSKCNNGGIVWCADNPYVNAISNELYLSVAAHLATRVSDNANYIKLAQDQWTWFKASGMINGDGTINDGLEDDCTNSLQRNVWSYNQGVILGGLVELNKAAPDNSLIDSARGIADAAIANLTDSNKVLHDLCEPDNSCAPDATQFKGIFMRNLIELQKASPSDLYAEVIKASAESIWTKNRDEGNNQLSVDWDGPFLTPANASTHSSAMDALIAAIGVE